MSRRPGPDPVLLVSTATAAAVGGVLGLLALQLLDVRMLPPVSITVILAVVIGSTALAGLLGRTPPRAQPVDRQPPAGPGDAPVVPPTSRAGGVSDPPPGPPTPGVRALAAAPHRVALAVPGGNWWTPHPAAVGAPSPTPADPASGSPAASAEPAPGSPAAAAADPASGSPAAAADLPAGTTRRIAQCPTCGDFAIDVARLPAGFDLRCTRCRHRWTWGPAHPWPPSIVRPRPPRHDLP